MRWSIGREGWVAEARRIISPNYDERPKYETVHLLVIHAISLPADQFGGLDIHRLFTNTLNPQDHSSYESLKDLRVSAHFLIRRTGELVQYVSCLKRAWHAGQSVWQGQGNCNDFSIGIELEGSEQQVFTEPQYEVLLSLKKALWARYPMRAIAGHEHIAPTRKTDPGPFFEWKRFENDNYAVY